MMVIPMSSALDFSIDNYKNYDKQPIQKYGDISIYDKGQLGEDTLLAKYSLIENDCSVVECYSKVKVYLGSSGSLISQVDFRNTADKSEQLNYQFYLEKRETYTSPVYEDVCEELTDKNGTKYNSCVYTQTKNVTNENVYNVPYNFETLPAREEPYVLTLSAKRKPNQAIDWIPSSEFGFSLNEWAWWDTSWKTKAPISINTTNATAIGNVSILMNITWNTSMSQNFSDLRFLDAEEDEELGYWFYNNTFITNNSVQVWVRMNRNISVAQNTTIWMYYNNSQVQTSSNIQKAFLFGDDFNGTNVNFNTMWQSADQTKYNQTGGILYMSAITATFNNLLNSNRSFNNYKMEARLNCSLVSSSLCSFIENNPTPQVSLRNVGVAIRSSGFLIALAGTDVDAGTAADQKWYRFDIDVPSSNNSRLSAKTDERNSTLHERNGTAGQTTNYLGLFAYANPGAVDWVYVRTYYNDAQLSYTLGASQGQTFLSISSTIVTPTNNSNLGTNIFFNGTQAATAGDLANATLYVWNSSGVNGTFTNTITGVTNESNYNISIADGTYYWNILACGTNSSSTVCAFSVTNNTLIVDGTPPTLNVTYPINLVNVPYQAKDTNLTINFTVYDSNIGSCLVEFSQTNSSIGCTVNTTSYNISSINNNSVIISANDTVGNYANSFRSWNYTIFDYGTTYNLNANGGSSQTFTNNFTYDNTRFNVSSVTLHYNNTAYSGTLIGTTNNRLSNTTLTVPAVVGSANKNFFWSYLLTNASSTIQINSTSLTQTIGQSYFVLCNATITNRFLNISFKDESTLGIINATIPTSTFTFWEGSSNVNASYTFINTTANLDYEFCYSSPSNTISVFPYVQYASSGYPQRVYNPSALTLTNQTTNLTLYLLSSSTGQYVTFQVVSAANQVLSGVAVTATRSIGGSDVTVGYGTTGEDGTVTFWLDPNFVHSYTFVKSGLPSVSSSFAPTQTSYTITMGSSTSSVNTSIQGISYLIYPNNSFLYNDTSYTFGINLSSTYWSLDSYGFNLRLKNGTVITGATTSTSGTLITTTYDTNNQSIIYMDYFWAINGNYSNATQFWIVQNTDYTQWSIAVFFTDLNTYIDSGLFGLDEFGRYLIAFLVLFITTGVISYKYGLTSPLSVFTMVFAVVFFLDVVTGILPDIRGISHLLTYISALVLILVILREVER